ncbi:MAG: bifunctional riboflavin kinase/FAD synthetase, partial [Actinomycetota bacterium]
KRTDLAALKRPPQGAAVAVGKFDGVHLGHRALLSATLAQAHRRSLAPLALTWDRHPASTLRPQQAPPLLTSIARKLELLREQDLDQVAVLAFDEDLASWPPERFASDVLAGALGAKLVMVGQNWRFGRRAAGNVDTLARLGADLGFEARAVQLERPETGGVVSSTRIRAALRDGDVEDARLLLGRPFDFDGTVVHGDGRGALLGYPTANLEVDAVLVRPQKGIYAGRALVDGDAHSAALSIGVNPTFVADDARPPIRIEAYLLDFSGDLYGRRLRIELLQRLRDELSFESTSALVEQMARDVAATRAVTG